MPHGEGSPERGYGAARRPPDLPVEQDREGVHPLRPGPPDDDLAASRENRKDRNRRHRVDPETLRAGAGAYPVKMQRLPLLLALLVLAVFTIAYAKQTVGQVIGTLGVSGPSVWINGGRHRPA